MKTKTRFWLVAVLCCCTTVSWGAPVPTGPISDYLVHCEWTTYSAEWCARLADRLAAVERPTPAERLALLKARGRLVRHEGGTADDCPGLAALVADHPDYAYALYYRSSCLPWNAPPDEDSAVSLLLRAVEIEPDNYLFLEALLGLAEGFPPEAVGGGVADFDFDPGTLASHREAMYEAGKAYASWWQTVDPDPDDPPTDEFWQHVVWNGPVGAGRYIHAAAAREGDLAAAEAIRERLNRDLGLDALDYGAENARASLALACHPGLYYLGMEEACVSAVEKLGQRASAAGEPLQGYVLKAIDHAAGKLRRNACAAATGAGIAASLLIADPVKCSPGATETAPVRRLRAVLEYHGGPRSSEHHRVHAQGFLGGDDRLEGLRAAVRSDAENTRARCDLARALASRGDAEEAAALYANPECMDSGDFAWGDISAQPDAGSDGP